MSINYSNPRVRPRSGPFDPESNGFKQGETIRNKTRTIYQRKCIPPAIRRQRHKCMNTHTLARTRWSDCDISQRQQTIARIYCHRGGSLLLANLHSTNYALISEQIFSTRALTANVFPAVLSRRMLTSSISLSFAGVRSFCLFSRSCVPAAGDRGQESAMRLESIVLSPDTFRQLSGRWFWTKID